MLNSKVISTKLIIKYRPELGKNYIDYHTEDGKCGLTIIFRSQNQKFDIIIEPHKE